MNRRLLLGIFKKTFLFVLLTTLFGGMDSFAQTSGYGDFIIFEDFGKAIRNHNPNHPSQEYYSSSQNAEGGEVYFRKAPLADIDPDNLIFYIPSDLPDEYQGQNWGPQYRDNVSKGSYSIVTNSRGYQNVYFVEGLDHTDGDDELGYMLLVDAHSSTELYFDRLISELCAGTTFEFSAWVKDVNAYDNTKPQIRFDIINAENDQIIDYYESTDEDVSPANTWQQVRMEFEMPAGVSAIKLRITNIVPNQDGNDIAIDDIGFRPMGPGLDFEVDQQLPACAGDPVVFTARVTDASEAYPINHFVLQRRENGSSGTWQNVGSYKTSIGTDPVDFTVPATPDQDNFEFRVVVAGDPETLGNENCSAVSEPKLLRINNQESEISVTGGGATVCVGEAAQLTAAVSGGIGDPDYTYVWEKSTDQTRWENILGATDATLNTGPLGQTTYYKVTARIGGVNGCPGAGASDVFTVIVNPTPGAPVVANRTTYVGATGIGYDVTALPDHTLIWFDENDNPLSPNEEPAVNTAVAGEYTAYVAQQNDDSGCISPIVPVKVVVKPIAITVEKSVNLTSIDELGPLTYTVSIKNTGEYDLTDVQVADILTQQGASDEIISDIGTPVQSGGNAANNANSILEIDETWTYIFDYSVDQGQIDRGAALVNTVSVTTKEGAAGDDDATTTITHSPSVAVEKVVDETNIAAPSTLNYTITVENTGNVSLTGIAVSDAVAQDGTSTNLTLGTPSGDDTNPGILDVGETWTYAVSHAAEQSHIDNGSDIVNTFTFDANELTDGVSDDATTTITQSPSVAVEKTVDQDNIAAPGTLNYTIVVANTGNVSLTGIAVSDAVAQGGTSTNLPLGTPSGDDTNPGILDVGETWTYAVSHAAEQSHIDNGSDIVNTFTFDANELTDGVSDDATTTITQSPSVAVEKTVDQDNIAAPGTLNYTIVVANTGNVSLTGIAVSDAVAQDGTSTNLPLGTPSGDDTNPGILDVGETWTYAVSHAAEQSHIDNGGDIVNTFTFNADELTSEVSDDATTTITQSPSVAVEKVVDETNIAVPSTLNYTITVENTGNVSLTGIAVNDAVAQDGASTALTPGTPSGDDINPGILDVGETWTYTVSHAAEQSHIDNGSDIVNTFTFNADELTSEVSDDATTTITQSPSVAVEKVVDETNIAVPSTLNYTITVENTGNVSLTGIAVNDVVAQDGASTALTPGTPSGDDTNPGILDVGETWTYTVSHAAEQSHIDNGSDIVNTFTFNADELGTPVSDDATTTITQSASAAVEKVVDEDNISAPATLNYTITVENTGNVSLTGISVSDAVAQGGTNTQLMLGTPSGDTDADGELDVDETWTYTVSHAAEQSHIDNGSDIVNVFTFDASELTDETSDDATTTITQSPSVAVEKVVDETNIAAPSTLNYTITVENTGNVSLTGIAVSDAVAQGGTNTQLMLGTPSGDTDADGELDVDETWTYTVSHAAEQSHIDNGGDIVNTFTFDADELGTPVSDDATTTITQSASAAVEKVVDETNIAAPSTLNYTITVENTGNVSLTGISVSDAVAQDGASTALTPGTPSGDDINPGILDVGETWTYTVSHAAEQSHIDNGSDIVNVFTFNADELGTPVSDDATTTITQSASVAVEKVVDETNIAAPSTLNYTITVENTGNVSLTGIAVSDAVAQGGTNTQLVLGAPSGDTDADGELDVDETWTYTVSHAAEQSHIDNGSDIVNTFTFNADELTSEVSDDATTTITQSASAAVEKVVDETNIAAPSTLNYTITVENTGNISLTGIAVSDAVAQDGTSTNLTLGTPSGDDTNPGILDVGETWTYTVSHAAEQSHIDNGGDIVNTFTFNADELTSEVSDDATTTITQSASAAVEKVVDETNIAAPSTLNYTITVENTGNVSLTGIAVSDAVAQGGTNTQLVLGTPSGDTDADGELDVDETWTYTVTYAATQSHIDNGGDIVNTFTFDADELTSEVSDDATTEITRNAAIEVTKIADKTTVSAAGEVITYTITVTNTGNVTLEDYTVSDVLFPEWSGSIDELAPAATRSFELEYTVTQSDIDKGGVVNVASVTGNDPDDPTDEDEEETPSDKRPGIEVTKVADRETVRAAGEVIAYTITVTNTGNVTLEDYTVSDVLFPEWSASIDELAPAATRSFELEYTVTQADIDNGGVVNVASATGGNPGDPEDEDEIEVPVGKDISIDITKVADRESFSDVGDIITYTITVTNTGNVTLSNVVVTDILFPEWKEEIATLAPKANQSFELKYTITAADVEEGSVVNVAKVDAKDPDGGTPGDETEIEVPGVFGPVAKNDAVSTNQGIPVTINVVGNDEMGSKPIVAGTVRLVEPGTGNAVTTVTIEGEGTYTVGTDGTVLFTPEAEYVGNSTITYTVKDENGLESNAATITVTVEGVAAEIAPSANDDQATTPYGQSVTITALANDQPGSSPIVPSTVRLIDGAGPGATTVTVPGEGRYTVDAQGMVTFEPADGFTGTSTVRYEVTDENGLVSNIATISVTVQTRPFKIPNVFTPNGDGRNDVFEIVGIEGFDRVEITVVNRWGNEVYRNNNYKNDWDGQGLNEGTYYYVIITHDGSRQERYAGWVLIKKQ